MTASIAPSIQYSWDGPGSLSAGQDGLYLRWNNATGRFEMASAGVSDHGGLTGLSDDDHTQYLRMTPTAIDGRNAVALSGAIGTTNVYGHHFQWSSAPGTGANSIIPVSVRSGSGAVFGMRLSDLNGASFYVGNVSLTGGINSPFLLFTGNTVDVYYFGALRASLGQSTALYSSASSVGLVVRGAASQTANLTEWQNSAGTVLSSVTSDGRLLLPVGATAAPSVAYSADTDTGIRFVGAGDIRVVANGTDVFQFAAAGNTTFAGLTVSGNKNFTMTGGLATFNPWTSAGVAVIIKLPASHAANALEVNSSAGSGGDVLRVTAAGALTAAAAISTPTEYIATGASATLRFTNGAGGTIKLGGGGTLQVTDGSSNILATFIHAGGGTLRNAGTTRIQWDATGIGFFGVTPVARPTALTAADAGALNTGDATSDTVIGNMRTRIGELETKLQALGLLT